MSKSSQESSPITQWEESIETILPCTTSCGSNADPADGFGYCTCGAESQRQHLTSATIELMTQIIGPDDDVTDLKNFNSVAEHRNDLRNQLRQSLKELKDNATKD